MLTEQQDATEALTTDADDVDAVENGDVRSAAAVRVLDALTENDDIEPVAGTLAVVYAPCRVP